MTSTACSAMAGMLLGDPLGDCTLLEQRLQAVIQQVDSGEVMQNALVDTQRRGREAVARFHFQEAEAAQWTVGRQRAPVRFGEGRQRQSEGGVGSLRMALRFPAARGQMGIHFHAGAQKEQIALEAGSIQKARRGCRWRKAARRQLPHPKTRPWRCLPSCHCRATQEPLEARQFGGQRSLVRLGPQHLWFGRRHTVMKGPVKAGGVAAKFTAMGLSTPSTRRRAR